MSRTVLSWVAIEKQGFTPANVRVESSMEITPEMWEKIKKDAAEAGMDPKEYFDKVLEELNQVLEGPVTSGLEVNEDG